MWKKDKQSKPRTKSCSTEEKIGSKIESVTKEDQATNYPIQIIAVAIQRGNVTSIMGKLHRIMSPTK